MPNASGCSSGAIPHAPPSRLLLALTAFAVLVATQLAPSPADASFSDSDGDGAIDLAEEIFGSNPAEASSTPETADFPFLRSNVACSDALDNDADGAIDAADGGCIDSDGSFPSDETELRLGSDPDVDNSFPEDSRLNTVFAAQGYIYLFAVCANGEDDDGDGMIDAADPGCAPVDTDGDGFDDFVEKTLGSGWHDAASQPEHVSLNPGSCGDGVDNDGDGAIDAADEGCVTATNDDRTQAVVVDSLPFSHTAKLVGATTEIGERQPSCSFADATRGTIWYRFTTPSDSHVVIETTGSDLVSAVSVWREGLFGLTEVACNSSFFYFNALPSRFAFAAVAGTTYYIQVERYVFEELGDLLDLRRLRFHMEATSPPVNDDFADAEAIDSLPFTASVDTIAAGTEPSEPDASCRFQGYPTNSVWYRLTPAADTYIFAEVIVGTDFGVTLGAYDGASLGTLEQVACGDQLAFLARAGHTYYLQGAGYQCQAPAGGEGGTASICIDSRAGHLALRVDTFDLPSCPAPQFTVPDPVGDTKPHADAPDPIDITSVSIAFTGETACVTIGVGGPIDPRHVWANVHVDADDDRTTGARVSTWGECGPLGVGAEFRASAQGIDGLLADVYSYQGAVGGGEPGFATYTDSFVRLYLPLSRIGGDGTLRLAIESFYGFGSRSAHFSDCAPNGGNITCQNGVCAFSPFRNGDANCGGAADSIDAAIVLQFGAGLLDELACPDAADVNGDSLIDSRDAALILQLGAGLLDRLPPEQPRF